MYLARYLKQCAMLRQCWYSRACEFLRAASLVVGDFGYFGAPSFLARLLSSSKLMMVHYESKRRHKTKNKSPSELQVAIKALFEHKRAWKIRWLSNARNGAHSSTENSV